MSTLKDVLTSQYDTERYRNDYFIIRGCELSLFELAWYLEKYLRNMTLEKLWGEEPAPLSSLR
jgi:hypothetical protein